MEDIRSLYRRAKFGGPSDRAAYADAIAEAARTDPVGYLSQLEYIICSGTGLDSFDRFMTERAPLPLAAMRSISVTFDTMTEAAKDKLGTTGSERYLAAAEKAATYLDANEHLLAMFEAFENEVADGYLDHAIGGEMNYARAIDRFGAAALPDCLLGCFGEVSPVTVFEYAVDHPAFGKPGMKQWLVEASRDLPVDPEFTTVMERVRIGALGNTVTILRERTEQLYREAVLTEEELEVQFTEAEIDSLRDYSEFQHYLVTALRSEDAIMQAWNEACRADAELAPLIEEESCADLAAMLPTGQMVRSINEGRDQKTGKIPRFISKHHNLNYGEEDDPPATGASGSNPAKNVDDYTRPTATGTKGDRSDDYVALDDDETIPASSDRATTNYYYNYYNSFNRNHRDDHSNHHTDNSVNKRIRSDNVTVPKGKGSDRTEDADDSYSEGFKDFIGKVAKGIKGLTMRKSLANLQARDRPEASMVKVPPHLLGSGIPLAPVKPIREATTLEDILDLGYVITEAGDSPFGLSKNDIKNIVNRLKSKFNAEILFISDSNPAITDMIGPASVVETDRATIDKMVKGGKLDRIPSFAAGDDRTNFEKVILINAKTMASWKLARPRDLEVVISHEYGHVLTYDQLTQRDWLEYTCKQQAIVSLVQTLYHNPSGLLAEMNYFYYKLKPEVLANRAANIDPKDLTNVLFGKRATGKIRELDLDVIVNWNVPDTIINQTARAIKGDTNFSQQDIIASINISTEVYGRAITDTTCRNWFMNILKEQAKQLTEQFSESGEIRFDSIFNGETDDLFEERSHGKLDSSFRMAANIRNGHMIKIVFDLDPKNVFQIGDHTQQVFRNAKRDQEYIKHIRRDGFNDFSSLGTVKAIIDLDTGERLKEVRTIGLLGDGGTRFKIPKKYEMQSPANEPFQFHDLPVKTREAIAREAKLNPPDAITFKVGESESKPTYKATTAWKSVNGLYMGQVTEGKGAMRTKRDMSVNRALEDIEKEYDRLKTKYGEEKLKATGLNYIGYQAMLHHFKEQMAKHKDEKFGQTIGSARYCRLYEGLSGYLGMMKAELKRTFKESADPMFEAGSQLVGEMQPGHGFNVITGEWSTDEIVEKLVEFLRSAYFEKETKVIAAVKALAEDEHHVLGNVVMEPGLETMWTDRYHLEEMLLGPNGNVIFAADTGETILFEHIIGSNAFDPTKVTWEKLEALIDQYRMDRSILDELRRTNGEDIADWGRIEWGGVATEIFERFTFPQLKALELPSNCQLEPYYDGSPWDDTFGARLVFTDIHDELRKFNDTIAQAGNVTTSSTNLPHRESGPAYNGDCSEESIEPGTLTENEIVKRLTEAVIKTYRPQLRALVAEFKRVADGYPEIVGSVNENFADDIDDWTNFFESCVMGNRHPVIFDGIVFSELDTYPTAEEIQKFIDDHHISKAVINRFKIDNYISRQAPIDPSKWKEPDRRYMIESFDEYILQYHTLPRLKRLLKLPENVNLYGTSSKGLGVQFTDVDQFVSKFNDELGDGGKVNVTIVLIDEFDFVESADMMSTVFEVGPISYTDGIEVRPGTMTEKELQGRLAKELAKTYQPQLHRLYSDLDRIIRHDRRIVGNLKADYLGNFTWDDPNYFENACLIGTRNEGAIFTASHFRNLDRAGGAVTMETIRTFFHEHAIPMELLSGLGTEPSNQDQIDPEWLDQVIFREHTWPIIWSAVKLPSNVNLYKIGTYDYDGFGIQFTDAAEAAERVNAVIGDGGTVRIKVTPIGEDEWVESAKVEPEEEDPNADPERPTSDHPIKDTIQDIDRVLTKKGAAAKKKVNDAINVGRVITKPVKRTIGWIDNIINRLKDANETKVKEELADPHRRNALFKAIRTAIGAGALYKAGLLLNPIFLFLAVANTAGKRRKDTRLRSEVIGQLKAELEVTEEKIRDADRAGDNSAKYKLMRFKTELEKKLVRVSGGREIARII